MPRLGLLRRSGSFKVTNFGTNRKPICNFLLVINSNLPPILHRFRDITSERFQNRCIFLPLWFNLPPPTEGFHWDDLRKILPGCRQVTNVLNGDNIAENFNRLSRVHERYRQTTDGRTTTYSEHEHEFTFANNCKCVFFKIQYKYAV